MKNIAFLLVGLLFATAARGADGDLTLSEWASGMLKRLPFSQGMFDHSAFEHSSRAYLDDLVSAYVATGEKQKSRAEHVGDVLRAENIETRTRRLVAGATEYVQDTAAGMLATIDPEKTGRVRLKDARKRLEFLAALADLDGDRLLDRYEAALAEAAFAKGRDLGRPGEARRLMRELDDVPLVWR